MSSNLSEYNRKCRQDAIDTAKKFNSKKEVETMYSMTSPEINKKNAIIYVPESRVREKLDKGYSFCKKKA